MILDEFMKSVDENQVFAIGSKSQYFFIGTKEEYERDIDTIAELHYENMKARKKLSENNIAKCQAGLTWDGTQDLMEYSKELIHLGNSLQKSLRTLAMLDEALDNYVPIRERKLKDKYKSCQPDCRTNYVVVEGGEQGSFWLREEYLLAREKGSYTAVRECLVSEDIDDEN